MRNLRDLDKYRAVPVSETAFPAAEGMFQVGALRVVAASAKGWDHVSVSLPDRCPTWAEMDHIKRLFFRDDEWAMQLHAPPAKHISIHPHVLHIWRPHAVEIPLPPVEMV